jgi:crossover junction endodeoxyribonuclease RuvC
MKIIGIDPGSIVTGIGIIEYKHSKLKLIEYDAINLSSKEPLTARLKQIYDKCLVKIKKFKPDEFAIETAFYGKNIQSTLKLGQARGVAIISAVNSNLKISEYSPREIKKSVTGSGASSKQRVQFMVKNILSIKEDPLFIDSTDALAVALCHYYFIENTIKTGKKKKKYFSKKNDWKEFIEKNPERLIKKITTQ